MLSNGGRNGGLSNHLPWFFDSETTAVFKKYIDLHYNLMPLFYSETLIRGKENLLKLNKLTKNSYYISNDIVVFNNLFSESTCNFDTNYKWINILTDEIVNDKVINFNDNYENISSFIKNGTIIPFYNFYNNPDTIEIKIFPLNSNKKFFYLPKDLDNSFCKIDINYSTKNEEVNINSSCNKSIKLLIKSKNNVDLISNQKIKFDEQTKYFILNIDKSKKFSNIKIIGLKDYK